MTIRPARPADADDLDDICLRTGNDGDDARERFSDPRLLGAVYVGPYLALEPDLAFVHDVGDGRAGGYVLGARDTGEFARACELHWWPTLRTRYPRGAFAPGTADAEVVTLIHDPPTPDPAVLARYPSHLHIDLLPRWQGAGWGRRLIEHLLAELAATGSPGVHLTVSATNARAIAFYRRTGFVDLVADGGGVTLGRRLGEAGRRARGGQLDPRVLG
ncbi:MAG: GNAT family N-acetyltransferase [Cellulomonas sp.]|nr:GNAT family N-acetyltransferase [Cellulomonas sp.]